MLKILILVVIVSSKIRPLHLLQPMAPLSCRFFFKGKNRTPASSLSPKRKEKKQRGNGTPSKRKKKETRKIVLPLRLDIRLLTANVLLELQEVHGKLDVVLQVQLGILRVCALILRESGIKLCKRA